MPGRWHHQKPGSRPALTRDEPVSPGAGRRSRPPNCPSTCTPARRPSAGRLRLTSAALSTLYRPPWSSARLRRPRLTWRLKHPKMRTASGVCRRSLSDGRSRSSGRLAGSIPAGSIWVYRPRRLHPVSDWGWSWCPTAVTPSSSGPQVGSLCASSVVRLTQSTPSWPASTLGRCRTGASR